MINFKDIKLPSWIKLDNAAIIYPSTLSKKYASMFRMSVTLNEEIDTDVLDSALNNVICRFPSFRYKLKRGLFWYYFKFIDGIPPIQDDFNNPMLRINFKDNNDFMFRVRCFGKRISVEYFHALTDGTGGITFLLTLTGEYLRLKKNIDIKYNDFVLNPNDNVKKNDYSDNFYKYARNINYVEKEKNAYHYKGTKIDKNHLNIITGIVSINQVKEICKKYNCTITEFIVSVMIDSIQEIQEREKRKKKKPIKISVPVNLRKYYSTKTMRNFSSYVNVGIETILGHHSFDEIINEIKGEMIILNTEKKLNSKISGNVKLEKNIFVRLIPLFIKKYIISIVENLIGDKYFSSTFSNLGLINVPDNMKKYINELGFILGKSRNNNGACACVGFNNYLYISFSKKIKESEFERLFFTKLVEMGIQVEIESNIGR